MLHLQLPKLSRNGVGGALRVLSLCTTLLVSVAVVEPGRGRRLVPRVVDGRFCDNPRHRSDESHDTRARATAKSGFGNRAWGAAPT